MNASDERVINVIREKKNLFVHVRSRREVWDILAQVLLGLRHIHLRGVVHRDVK